MNKTSIDKVLEKLVLECGSEKAKEVLEENKKLKAEIEQLSATIDVLDQENKDLYAEIDDFQDQLHDFENLKDHILEIPEEMGSLALDVERMAKDFVDASFTYAGEIRTKTEKLFAKKNKKKSRR